MTAYFASVYLGKRAKLAILVQHIERAAKRIYGVPEFRFYAIADGIKQLLFSRATGIGPPPPNTSREPASSVLLNLRKNGESPDTSYCHRGIS